MRVGVDVNGCSSDDPPGSLVDDANDPLPINPLPLPANFGGAVVWSAVTFSSWLAIKIDCWGLISCNTDSSLDCCIIDTFSPKTDTSSGETDVLGISCSGDIRCVIDVVSLIIVWPLSNVGPLGTEDDEVLEKSLPLPAPYLKK